MKSKKQKPAAKSKIESFANDISNGGYDAARETQSNPAYAGFYPVIAPLVMCAGIGDGKTTSCVMAQAATIDALRKGKTLEVPTDQMECACPVLRRLAIRANDISWWKSDAERTEHLRPLIPLLLDSRGDDALTRKRAYFCADTILRKLTPMRLEYIAAHTKSTALKKEIAAGLKQMTELAPITDGQAALAARGLLEKLRASAYASAYAYADASAYAYAYASAYAYADAYASASASASASAYAYADASAYADAYAYAYADADAQKLKYRAVMLQMFRDCAAIK